MQWVMQKRLQVGVAFFLLDLSMSVLKKAILPSNYSVNDFRILHDSLPNPARGRVTVLSSYRPVSEVVYNLQGHAVLESVEDSRLSLPIGNKWATTIDVSTLASGVYVVARPTPVGIATKRQVVE